MAFVRNPAPRLMADVQPRLVPANSQVTISGVPVYVTGIEGDIKLDGTVRRPDGSLVPIVLTKDPLGGGWGADFFAVGRGTYEVSVDLAVGKAQTEAGESIFTGPERYPTKVYPFVRTQTVTFRVAGGDFPKCRTKDCDWNH